jgi:Protein of unknown function (DUF2939)
VFALEHANPGNRDPPALSSGFVAQQWHTPPILLLCSNSSTAKFRRHIKGAPGVSSLARPAGVQPSSRRRNDRQNRSTLLSSSAAPGILKAMRPLKLLLAAALLAVAYMAWPLLTALQIREAIIAGDTATLERKIEWAAVRSSLKVSLSAEAKARLEKDPNAPAPSLWQRIKATVAPSLADSAVDRYVTPENLPSFFGYRETYRNQIRPALGMKEPPTLLAGTLFAGTPIDRVASFYARVRRAVFYSLTRFEVEIVDRYQPERRYVSTFELKGLEWKLTALAVLGAGY